MPKLGVDDVPRVTFNRAHEEPRQIATAQKFAEALAAARKAGALLHEGKGSGQDFVFDVSGHEGDRDFAITIETPRALKSVNLASRGET